MVRGKLLGVDYGDRRTGIAVSDPSGLLATGIGCIQESGMRHTAERVAEAAKENGVVGIVIGLPKNMDGTEGFRAEAVRAFGELLSQYTDLPLSYLDERLSTMQAHTLLDMSGTHGKKRKERVDTLSAQIILQDYLDRERNK